MEELDLVVIGAGGSTVPRNRRSLVAQDPVHRHVHESYKLMCYYMQRLGGAGSCKVVLRAQSEQVFGHL